MAPFYYICFVLTALSGLAKGTTYDYKIRIYTADVEYAGTDASVYIRFFQNGRELVNEKLHPAARDPYERGDTDVAIIRRNEYFGKIDRISVKRGRTSLTLTDDWDLDKIIIEDPVKAFLYVFACNCELGEAHKWRSISGTVECKSGYTMSASGQCEDVDECNSGSGHCSDPNALCTNTIGSYHCRACKRGYRYNGQRCEDIDECLSKQTHTCSQGCVNNQGSYTCECFKGYRFDKNKVCQDIDECKEQQVCDKFATCVNHAGGYTCVCHPGYERKDGRCQNIDECKANKCDWKTSHDCTDYDGGYKCHCKPGYYNKEDHICEDINECDGQNVCDPKASKCVNLIGSYRCECFAGYKPNLNGKGCVGRSCNPLVVTTGAIITPSQCSQADANKYNDVCTFSCKPGYKLSDPSHSQVTCGLHSSWTGVIPRCVIAATCVPLSAPANGRVIPSQCTSGAKYKDSCTFYCNDGYIMQGSSAATTCQVDGRWSSKAPICKKVQTDLWIRCPSSISVDLKQGESTADISNMWPRPSTSGYKYISSSHNKNDRFPVGMTSVKWTISNDNVVKKSCTFLVSVYDKEKPVAVGCPTKQRIILTKTMKTLVNLTQVRFTDNVKVETITYSHISPVELGVGVHPIKVTAADSSGNRAYCNYEIKIAEKRTCRNAIKPLGGDHQCFGTTTSSNTCTMKCRDNKVIFNETGLYFSAMWYCHTEKWYPTETVPDCVEYADIGAGSTCPVGKVLINTYILGRGNTKVCGACPTGMYYESKECKQCPAGTYLDTTGNIGQQSCKKCHAQATSRPGSTKSGDCKALCAPGYYSPDGFHPCQLCQQGEYQSNSGSVSCNKCPVNQTCTRNKGSTSASDCGVCPSLPRITPSGDIQRVVGHELKLSCYVKRTATGVNDLVKWRTPFDNSVVRSKVYVKPILHDATYHGLTLIIRDLKLDHAGKYTCVVENKFGQIQSAVHVKVLNSQGGGSGASPLNDLL